VSDSFFLFFFVFVFDMKALAVLAVLIAAYAVEAINNRPIIGILDQDLVKKESTYIAASYVKWIESAGARVVPLFYEKWSTQTMEKMLGNINGVLFPGGGVSISGKYFQQLQTIFNWAKKANDRGVHFPIWGTCLGFEELLCLAANTTSVIDGIFDSEDLSLALTLSSAVDQSKLFKAMPEDLKKIIATEKVTFNNHKHGIFTKHFLNVGKLTSFYNLLSVNEDPKGKQFVSTIEAKNYPIFGSQWHPEKILFEWTPNLKQINHSRNSVEVNGWVARFFVDECRKNDNHFANTAEENKALIYQYTPTYTGDKSNFEQKYIFH